MKAFIELKQMEFYAYHGVLEQERVVGNTFWVDVRLNADISKAMKTDKVEDTVDYAEVYALVKKEMQIPSHLLEHVAGRIIRSIKARFPRLNGIKVSVAKANPPIEGQLEYVKVEVED